MVKSFIMVGPVACTTSVLIIIYDCNAWSGLDAQNQFGRLLAHPKIVD